jgi:hypothetical protein
VQSLIVAEAPKLISPPTLLTHRRALVVLKRRGTERMSGTCEQSRSHSTRFRSVRRANLCEQPRACQSLITCLREPPSDRLSAPQKRLPTPRHARQPFQCRRSQRRLRATSLLPMSFSDEHRSDVSSVLSELTE